MILSIDASTTGCSVALFDGQNLVSAAESRIDRSSAELFTTLIDQVLKNAKVYKSELTAIAVAKGPGSYTGLRIAVSTAKGLAYALDLPIISYGTLELLSHQVFGVQEDTLLCPMIDARRMEVYCAFFETKTLKQVSEISATIIDENSFEEILSKNKVLFFGEGSAKCKGILNNPNAKFEESVILPTASFSGKICHQKFENKDFEDLTLFEPYYLKEYMFKTKKP